MSCSMNIPSGVQ